MARTTRHRFLETVAFWLAVSNPGGLQPGGRGRNSALRVRIMHVFVRRRLLQHPEWDLEAWGVPISQADAMLTLMGGSVAPAIGLRAAGYRTSSREIEATLHFWRYIGHLMGVRPRWYPSSASEGLQLLFVTMVKAARRSGADGDALCSAYVQAFRPTSPGLARLWEEWDHRRHIGYTRFFLPIWNRRRAGLAPIGVLGLLVPARFPLVFAAETLRRRVPALDALSDRVISARRERWYRRYMGSRQAEYRPVRDFTR